MADLRSAYQEQEKKKRHMRFSSTVHVCLVPTRMEMNNIFDDLYFRPEDFSTFKREAVTELREVLTRLGITSKQAIKLMYQPEVEEETKESLSRAQDYTVGPSLSDDDDDNEGDDDKVEGGDITDTNSRHDNIEERNGPSKGVDNMTVVIPPQQTMPSAANKGSPPRANMKVRFVVEEAAASPVDANPSIAAAKANVISAMENNIEHLASNDEGPSLSDDEEESKKYEDRINRTIKAAAPFLTGVKTDVELNSIKETHSSKNVRINLPSKTPSGGGVGGSSDMWEALERSVVSHQPTNGEAIFKVIHTVYTYRQIFVGSWNPSYE